MNPGQPQGLPLPFESGAAAGVAPTVISIRSTTAQERLFREVYNDVRKKEEKNIDFSMNPMFFIGGRNTWTATMFSQTIIVFYGSLIAVMIAVEIFLLK